MTTLQLFISAIFYREQLEYILNSILYYSLTKIGIFLLLKHILIRISIFNQSKIRTIIFS